MRLPTAIERELQAVEQDIAARGGQQAGAPRLRALRAAIETALRPVSASLDVNSWRRQVVLDDAIEEANRQELPALVVELARLRAAGASQEQDGPHHIRMTNAEVMVCALCDKPIADGADVVCIDCNEAPRRELSDPVTLQLSRSDCQTILGYLVSRKNLTELRIRFFEALEAASQGIDRLRAAGAVAPPQEYGICEPACPRCKEHGEAGVSPTAQGFLCVTCGHEYQQPDWWQQVRALPPAPPQE